MIVWRRQAEHILEAVLHRRIALQEVVKSFGQSGHNDDGVVVPLVHLDKELVEGVHLVGILVGQQLLNVVKEEDAVLGLLDIVVPVVDEPAVVYRIDNREFRLLYNLVLIEIFAQNLCKCRLARSRLTYYYCIHRKPHIGNVLSRAQIGVSIDNGFQLGLDFVQAYQFIEDILAGYRLAAPLTVLGDASIFLMTIFANHSTSFSNCLMILCGCIFHFPSRFGLRTFMTDGLKTTNSATSRATNMLQKT